MRLSYCGMQRNLASPTQCHVERRAHHGLWRELDQLRRLLELPDQELKSQLKKQLKQAGAIGSGAR